MTTARRNLIFAAVGFVLVILLFTVLSRAAASFSLVEVRAQTPATKTITNRINASTTTQQRQEIAIATESEQLIAAIYVAINDKVDVGSRLFKVNPDKLNDSIKQIEEDKYLAQLRLNLLYGQIKQAQESILRATFVPSATSNITILTNNINNVDKKTAVKITSDKLANIQTTTNMLTNSNTSDIIALIRPLTTSETPDIGELASPAEQADTTEPPTSTDNDPNNNTNGDPNNNSNQNQTPTNPDPTTPAPTNPEPTTPAPTTPAPITEDPSASATTTAMTIEELQLQVQTTTIEIDRYNRKLDGLYYLRENDCIVTAPTTGVVTAINARVGDMTMQTAIILMADTASGCVAVFSVPEDYKKHFTDDVKVSIKNEFTDTTTDGIGVASVIKSTNNPNMLDVTIYLQSDIAAIGHFVTMDLVLSSKTYRECVPLSAIHQSSAGSDYVYVIDEEQSALGIEKIVRPVNVTVIASDSSYAAIDGSLGASQAVVVSSERLLMNKDKVMVLDD
ncbi:MAG: hypothetical protein LBG97_01170 [Coriobacteriales bacterium]|nr:hypothetical protein [Coriobacteriales bacterium]